MKIEKVKTGEINPTNPTNLTTPTNPTELTELMACYLSWIVWKEIFEQQYITKSQVTVVDLTLFRNYCPACSFYYSYNLYGPSCGNNCPLELVGQNCHSSQSLFQKWIASGIDISTKNTLKLAKFRREINQNLIYAYEISEVFREALARGFAEEKREVYNEY